MKRIHARHVTFILLFLAGFLAGCSSLPTFVPGVNAIHSGIVRLQGPRGLLTEKQSRKILEGLKSRGEEASSFQRHLALEEAIVGSPLVSGNKVTLLLGGENTYTSMLIAIRGAKDSINMESYIFDDDEMGSLFSDALLERRSAGVTVNLVYDSFGAMSTPGEFFTPLIEGGVNLVEFNPVNPLKFRWGMDINSRDHRKLLIVDGKVAFVGGVNISSVYSSGSFRHKDVPVTPGSVPWRDTHVRIEGPVVREFQSLYMQTWTSQKGKPLAVEGYFPQLEKSGDEVVRAIGSTPAAKYSLMYAALIAAIENADNQIYLTNAYFVPDPRLRAALKKAAAHGVDVRLMLPGKSDSTLVLNASRSFYSKLLRAGVKIYEHEDAFMHAKTVVIDGVWSSIGSTNLDWRSLRDNQEIDAVILGPVFGRQMQTQFTRDIQASREITREQWQQRTFKARFSQMSARLWARML